MKWAIKHLDLLLDEVLDFLQVQRNSKNISANKIMMQQKWISFLTTGQFGIKFLKLSSLRFVYSH